MITYLKKSIIPFAYMVLSSRVSMGILTIEDNLIWLKVLLSILNLGLYSVVTGAFAFKEGEQALKVRVANDIERKQIIRTGEDRPLKLHEEYKWWKGFLIGAISCSPIVVLMLVHTILILINPALNGSGIAASMIYLTGFAFMMLNKSVNPTILSVNSARCYFNFVTIVIVSVAYGIGYNLGARKIQLQQDAIKEKHREIHGEDL
jgi:hypothetical protein